jgi:hypothetical protein
VARARTAAAAAITALALSPAARAQTTPDDDARRALIAQATEARDAGDDRRALALARGAAAMRATPSLHLLLAELEERLALPADALADARACEDALARDRAYHNWQRYFDACHALVTALAARTVEPVAASVETPVTAPVETPVAATAVTPVAAPAVTPVAATAVTPVAVRGVARSAGAAPWAVMGVGAASLVASGVFFALRGGALADRDAACGTAAGACEPDTDLAVDAATRAQRGAHTFNALTNVSLGVGAAAVAGGVLWWALGRGGGAPEARRAIVVGPTAGGAFVAVVGAL